MRGFTILVPAGSGVHADAVLRDWYRVLRPGGRALFTDAMVVTGMVSSEELATRSSSLQRFLHCVHTRSVERRLTRYAYLAEKPAA
jgi:ubiquinone/menaquinone biosynthesis C-methylase UbiE